MVVIHLTDAQALTVFASLSASLRTSIRLTVNRSYPGLYTQEIAKEWRAYGALHMACLDVYDPKDPILIAVSLTDAQHDALQAILDASSLDDCPDHTQCKGCEVCTL